MREHRLAAKRRARRYRRCAPRDGVRHPPARRSPPRAIAQRHPRRGRLLEPQLPNSLVRRSKGTLNFDRRGGRLAHAELLDRAVPGYENARNAVGARVCNQSFVAEIGGGAPYDVSRRALACGDDIRAGYKHVDARTLTVEMATAAFQRNQNPLDPAHPADGRNIVAESRQQTIVSAAAAQRKTNLFDVAFKDETGVILQIAQHREVKVDASADAQTCSAVEKLLETIERDLRNGRHAQRPYFLEGLETAPKHGVLRQTRIVIAQ